MDQQTLDSLLADLPLGSLRYYDKVSSTNDLAIRWAAAGAPDLSVVVADEQTAGRGRLDRQWYTPPGAGLAFSLVLRPEGLPLEIAADSHSGPSQGNSHTALTRLTALGALAVCETLNQALPPMLPAQIKWPNDVIATRRKVAGVLVELQWSGSQLSAAILGIGINVHPQSVPPPDELSFPATCLDEVIGNLVDRWALLKSLLANFLHWKGRIEAEDFMQAWLGRLAFRGEWVVVLAESGASEDTVPVQEGQVAGINPDGSLRLRLRSGEIVPVQFGEIRLRQMDGTLT
jgi:BirA family biotin operon repressor/biotin-[acetyl-CoA-carboxylase] ligase